MSDIHDKTPAALDSAALSRRDMFRLAAGVGLAPAAFSGSGLVRAQVPEEANTESLMIERKGIDKELRVFNPDLLEEEAKLKYGHDTYVFVSHGSGDRPAADVRPDRRRRGRRDRCHGLHEPRVGQYHTALRRRQHRQAERKPRASQPGLKRQRPHSGLINKLALLR